MKFLPLIHGRSLSKFVLTVSQKILIGFFEGFWITLIVGTLLGLPANYNLLIIFVLGVLLSSWLIYRTCKKWYWEFRLDDDHIYLRNFTKKSTTINKDEIQEIEWKNSKVTISSDNKAISFDMRMFSGKQFVQLFYLLPRWLPRNVLTSEERQALDEKEDWISQFSSQSFNSSSSDFRRILRDRDSVIIMVVQGLMTIACLIGLIAAEEKIYPILIFFLFVLPLLIVGTAIILQKSLEITPQGIRYRTVLGKKFLEWTAIEAVSIRSTGITFWARNKHIHVSAGLFTDEMMAEAFWPQVARYEIPYLMVYGQRNLEDRVLPSTNAP